MRRPNNLNRGQIAEWALAERTAARGGCLEWTGARKRHGYGILTVNRRTTSIHRLIAEHYHGPAPDGRPQANHICHNPACINPAHLYWGTQAENVQDMQTAGRGRHLKGEAHPAARINDAAVRLMRFLWAGGVTSTEIAKLFGVSKSHARCVGSGICRATA